MIEYFVFAERCRYGDLFSAPIRTASLAADNFDLKANLLDCGYLDVFFNFKRIRIIRRYLLSVNRPSDENFIFAERCRYGNGIAAFLFASARTAVDFYRILRFCGLDHSR